MINKIAITGPESTGKSTLAEMLAYHYDTVWVKEYAREYLEKTNGHYDYNDILEIAKGQLNSEEQCTKNANKLLICDTELIVTKVWCDYKYNKCHKWILDNIKKSNYDLYLLCNIDIPWEYDVLREHPDLREYFFKIYLYELQSRNLPFIVVSGNINERLKIAIEEIKSKINELNNIIYK